MIPSTARDNPMNRLDSFPSAHPFLSPQIRMILPKENRLDPVSPPPSKENFPLGIERKKKSVSRVSSSSSFQRTRVIAAPSRTRNAPARVLNSLLALSLSREREQGRGRRRKREAWLDAGEERFFFAFPRRRRRSYLRSRFPIVS